jgi:hypothetical protein
MHLPAAFAVIVLAIALMVRQPRSVDEQIVS